MMRLILLIYHRLVPYVCAFFFSATCFCVANEKIKLALIVLINQGKTKSACVYYARVAICHA